MEDKQSWKLDELKELIALNYGKEYALLLEPSLNSIDKRQQYAGYHYYEYKSLLKELNSEADLMYQLKKIFSMGKEEQIILIKIEANIIACLQNMHAIHDLLGQVIKYAFELKFKNESRIYLKAIKIELEKNEKYEKLSKLLNELMLHDDFVYLNAIVNYSKHRSIIKPDYSINLEEEWSGIIFKEFTYGKHPYERKKADDFMVAEYSRESQLIVSIGQMINILVSQNKIGI